MKRSRTSGEARHGEIEAAPEEMDRTDLSREARPKPMKHTVNRNQGPGGTRHAVCIIGAGLTVVPEPERIGDFIGPAVEFRRTAETFHQLTEPGVKVGNGHRPERHFNPAPVRGFSDHDMTGEIEGDLDT